MHFTLPKFLLCEIPIKNGSPDDNRFWIYSTGHLSLIEVIYTDDHEQLILDQSKCQQGFQYINSDGIIENLTLIYHQNNVESVSNDTPSQVLEMAFKFLTKYFQWEDDNIDTGADAQFN